MQMIKLYFWVTNYDSSPSLLGYWWEWRKVRLLHESWPGDLGTVSGEWDMVFHWLVLLYMPLAGISVAYGLLKTAIDSG